MIVAQILRVSLEMKFIAGLVNTTLGEEKDRLRRTPIVIRTLFGNSETVERQRIFGGGKRDKMRVVFGLQKDPALLVRLWEPGLAPIVGHPFGQLLLLVAQELQSHIGNSLPARERENVQRKPGTVAFPDRAQVGQLD